jgi:hypothetical protein
MNQELRTITGGEVDSRLRPDVATKNKDGTIDVFEIPSASQTKKSQEEKVRKMDTILGDRAGMRSRVEEIRDEDKK